MSEASVQTSTFENLNAKELGAWILEQTQRQTQYYKSNVGRWEDDRFMIFENKNKEIKAAIEKKRKLDAAQAIYEEMSDYQKTANEPDRKIPFQAGEPTKAGGVVPQQQQQQRSFKSVGEMFTDSQAYKAIGEHRTFSQPYRVNLDDYEMKTTMTTAAGYAPPNDRSDIVIPYAVRQPTIADVVPIVQTGNNVVSWMEETTPLLGTQAQVSIAEGDNAKFENALAFTERTSVVETVGTWLAVTNQQLDDVPGIQSIINNRMVDFLRRAEEVLLLSGTGSTPQITGFLIKSGTNAFARTTETNIDAIWQGIQACRVTGFAEPDAIIMHPTNFTPIRLYKATTGDYSFDVTTDSGGVTRLFGKPLILTTAMTLNTALVGAFRVYSAIWRKMGLTVQVGLNSDDFTKNKKTVLAEYRETLAIYRAAAFTKVTALQ